MNTPTATSATLTVTMALPPLGVKRRTLIFCANVEPEDSAMLFAIEQAINNFYDDTSAALRAHVSVENSDLLVAQSPVASSPDAPELPARSTSATTKFRTLRRQRRNFHFFVKRRNSPMSDKQLVNEVTEISWHRNGVSGKGFYAVLFTATVDSITEEEGAIWALEPGDEIKNAKWYAAVGDEQGECYVVCLDLIPTRGVRFGGNSWRGDRYEPELRAAISEQASSGSVRVGPFGIAI